MERIVDRGASLICATLGVRIWRRDIWRIKGATVCRGRDIGLDGGSLSEDRGSDTKEPRHPFSTANESVRFGLSRGPACWVQDGVESRQFVEYLDCGPRAGEEKSQEEPRHRRRVGV